MRKLLFIIVIFAFIGGCSKHKEDRETELMTTPAISVTEDINQKAVPSPGPSPAAIASSVDDLMENKGNSDESESINDADNNSSNYETEISATENEILKELLHDDNNEFTGSIGNTKIHMKLSYQDDDIIGEYYYDKYKKDIKIKGNITLELKEYPAIHLMEDTEQYGSFFGIISTSDCIKGYWRDDEHVYPMYLIRVGSDADTPDKPINYARSYEGQWYGKNPSYFSGTELEITALFSDMIYYEFEAYNGGNLGSNSGIAFLDSKSATVNINYYYWSSDYKYQLFEFIKQGSDLYLNSSDYSYGCGMGVSFDDQYSKEKIVVDEPTAFEVGIVNSPELDEEFHDLVRTYYSYFIAYTSYVAYEEILLDGIKALAGESVLRGLGGYCYYILSEDYIYAAIIDADDIKFFTNDWNYYDHMPEPMQEWADTAELPVSYYNEEVALPFDEAIPDQLVQQIEQIKRGQKITLPEGYSLIEYSEGDINQDKDKDIAIVIQQYPGKVTGSRCIYLFTQSKGKYILQYVNSKILLGAFEGGTFGDPYDGISLEDGELHVYDYGGSSSKWSHDYGFKMLGDNLILYSIATYGIDNNSGEASESIYDFLNGTLETKTYNEFDPKVEEQSSSESFTVDHQISFEEAKAWLEEELETEE